MRLIAYCRTSTNRQDISLQDQEAKLRGYCSVYDHEIVQLIAESQSAKSLARDGFQRLLQLLRDGQADGVIVYRLDRLTRSVEDGQSLLREFFSDRSRFRKELVSVTEHISTDTASGRLLFNIALAVSQHERELTSERTVAALAHKRRNGQRVGEVTYGFDLAEDGVNLVENAAEQDGLALMRALRDQGQSYAKIAALMDENGFASKHGRAWKGETVRQILMRRSLAK